jgi:hypothetical protein
VLEFSQQEDQLDEGVTKSYSEGMEMAKQCREEQEAKSFDVNVHNEQLERQEQEVSARLAKIQNGDSAAAAKEDRSIVSAQVSGLPKAVVSDVRYDGILYTASAVPHYVAEDNHHHHSHMTGSKGHEPCRRCANEFDLVDNPNGQPSGFETDTEINLGQFLKIRNQFFIVKRIEHCEGQGCWRFKIEKIEALWPFFLSGICFHNCIRWNLASTASTQPHN